MINVDKLGVYVGVATAVGECATEQQSENEMKCVVDTKIRPLNPIDNGSNLLPIT